MFPIHHLHNKMEMTAAKVAAGFTKSLTLINESKITMSPTTFDLKCFLLRLGCVKINMRMYTSYLSWWPLCVD